LEKSGVLRRSKTTSSKTITLSLAPKTCAMANNAKKIKKFVFFHIQEDPYCPKIYSFSDEYGRSPGLAYYHLPSHPQM